MGRRSITTNDKPSVLDDTVPKKVSIKDHDGLKKLIAEGANLNCRDARGLSALEIALTEANFDAATILIEGGADVTEVNKLGLTFIHIIIRNFAKYMEAGHTQNKIFSVVRLLVDKGTKLNLQERRGNTPINAISQLARANKLLTEAYTRLAKLFLSLDKDVSKTIQIKNNMGKAPMDYLSRNGNLLLREAIYDKSAAVQERINAQLRAKDLEIKKLMSLGKELVK